jgi:mono/diheme cytochrome c family protein
MAEYQLLGLFHEATPTAQTIDQLRELGVSDRNITVMSSMPYRPQMLGRPRPQGRVGLFALTGAALGFGLGVFLTAGTFLLYPLDVGGQPVVPIPPSLIILFETTMLGTMWASFIGMLLSNRFPSFKPNVYDPRITEGHIGVALQADEGVINRAEEILRANGAHHFQRIAAPVGPDTGFRRIWLIVVAVLVVLTVAVLLPAYNIGNPDTHTQMAEQDVVAYDQGPRINPPAGAIPVQGPSLIGNQPGSTPAPASTASVQHGQALYNDICAMCHGTTGHGDGPLAAFFSPPPANLAGGPVRDFTDAQIFEVITNGFNRMPPQAENLTPDERWDVIHYIRQLQK